MRDHDSVYYVVLVLVLVCDFGLRMLVNSRFGQVVVAIREDETRTELFGRATDRHAPVQAGWV